MEDEEIKNLVKGVREEVARLEGKIPKEEKKEEEDYNCSSCGGSLTKGVKFCPYCGIELEW